MSGSGGSSSSGKIGSPDRKKSRNSKKEDDDSNNSRGGSSGSDDTYESGSDSDSDDEFDEIGHDSSDMNSLPEWAALQRALGQRPTVTQVEEKHKFSYDEYLFSKESNRPEGQVKVQSNIRKMLKKSVSKPLYDKDEVYIPKSMFENEKKIDLTPLQLERIGKKRGVYFVFKDGKVGRSVNLGGRYDDIEGIIIKIFDYDHAEPKVIETITKAIDEIANMPGVKLEDDIKNLNYDNKIAEMEEKGLPILPRLLFHLVANNEAGKIKCILNAINLNNIETALTQSFKDDYDIDVNEESALDEHLISNLTRFVRPSMDDGVDVARKFFDCLRKDEFDCLLKEPHMVEAILSWARRMTTAEKEAAEAGIEPLDACKVILTKIILGISGQSDSDKYWHDTIEKPPPGEEMFKKENYTDEDLKAGFKVLKRFIETIEKVGGIRAVDINELVVKHHDENTNLVEWLEGRGWQPFFSYLDLVVLRYTKETADGEPRMIFANRPMCWTLFSGQYKNGNTHRMMKESDAKSQARRCKTGVVLQHIFQVLRKKNASLDDIKPCSTIRENLLLAFAFRMYLLKNLHVFPLVATLFAKYLLLCEHINVLEKYYHRQSASEHGINLKEQSKSRRGPTKFDMDRQIRDKLLKKLTKARPSMEEDEVDEIFDEMIDLLKCSVPSEDSSQEDKKRCFLDMCDILVKFRDDQLLLPAGNHIYTTLNDKLASEPVGRLQDGIIAGAPSAAASTQQNNDIHANVAASNATTGFVGFPRASPP